MKVSDPSLRITMRVNLTPESNNIAGPTSVGMDYTSTSMNTKGVFVARIIFSAASQTAALNPANGVISLSATGTQQVATRQFVCSALSASGSLVVTLTGAILGSARVVNVPLVLGVHSTTTLIAAAVAAELNKMSAITDFFRVTSKGDRVTVTSIYGLANDATLALTLTAGLGVTAGDTAGAVSGSLGVIVQRQGSGGRDIFNDPWDVTWGIITETAMACGAGVITVGSTGRTLKNGQRCAFSDALSMDNFTSESFTAVTTPAWVDIVALCR